jgi:ribosomal protein S18 acetylase RimI-like enzyme
MTIRKAESKDFGAITSIDTVAPSDPQRSADIAGWIANGSCHVVEIDDQIVAYGVLTHHFFGHDFIDLIMVGAAFRRQGHARTLLDHFKRSGTTGKLFTSTNQSNHSMLALLPTAGFIRSGYIENLDDNDPEIVFCFLT